MNRMNGQNETSKGEGWAEISIILAWRETGLCNLKLSLMYEIAGTSE